MSELPPLVLASSSRYRAELLARLRLPFDSAAPDIDETPQAGESAAALVKRLAERKARALSARFADRWIIGSDQTAALGGALLGKPGSVEQARAQLAQCSAQLVVFHTAVCVLRGERVLHALDLTRVRFRTLDAEAIARYVAAEPALDCAGSFKCEGYGITLFEAIETSDPTALVGLPLIATARLLREAGYPLP